MTGIFRDPNFRKIWAAQLVSIFGDFLALFGIISLITFRWHGNPVMVTTVTIAYVLPLAVVGPFAGVLVDHWNVKQVMIVSDLIRAALALLLVFVSDVRQIAAILFVMSVVSSAFIPAQSIAVRTLIPKENLLAANAMLGQAFYLIRLISPLAAGAIISVLSEKATFYLDTASFCFSALMIGTLVIIRPARHDADKTVRGLTRDFLEGNRFIFTHRGLSFVFIAMAVAMFMMSAFSPLISIFVRDVLHSGPLLFGLVSAMVGVGMIVGTMVITKASKGKPSPKGVLYGMVGLAAATAVLGIAHRAPLAAVSTFLMGLAITFILVPAQTMSQRETPPTMVGRVSSTFMSMISIAQVLGLLLSGILAQRLGMRPLFLWSALGMVLIIAGDETHGLEIAFSNVFGRTAGVRSGRLARVRADRIRHLEPLLTKSVVHV
ncbi:MAG: MFS transporter [Acidobacteriaceae bacterium]